MEPPILQLSQPAFIRLELPPSHGQDSSHFVDIDLYKARRILATADKEPDENARWNYIAKWLGEQLQVDPNRLAENILYEFNDLVCLSIIKLNEVRSKKVNGIVSSLISIQESLTTSEVGN